MDVLEFREEGTAKGFLEINGTWEDHVRYGFLLDEWEARRDELTTRWNRESHVDLNGEMVQFMLRMTSALLFGLDDPEFAEKLGRLIDRWTHRNHEVGMGALVSAPQFARGYELLLQQAEELESSIREMFARHRSGNSDGLNILHLLMQATESGGSMTDDQLRAQFAAALREAGALGVDLSAGSSPTTH